MTVRPMGGSSSPRYLALSAFDVCVFACGELICWRGLHTDAGILPMAGFPDTVLILQGSN